MKKNLIVLLVIALVTVGLFAADPTNASFQVTADVSGINLMKITTAKYEGSSPTDFANNTTVPIYAGPLSVTASGAQTLSAYISTMSNSRSGYHVTMTATAMKSTVGSVDAYINYTVAANTKSITTNGATAVAGVKVIEKTSLSGLAVESHLITLTVDQTTFDAAVEGSYSGTVTFEYKTT